MTIVNASNVLQQGTVIPAHLLALDANRRLDERRQRALTRYYLDAGAGGLAVGVHSTQFAIRDPAIGLYQPVLALAAEEIDRADANRDQKIVRIAGICGDTEQAVREASIARDLGYQVGLLSLAALQGSDEAAILAHCRAVSEIIDLFGFYLQPSVGGIELPYSFWRKFSEIEKVVGIKVAAFNRYQTIDVVRAIAESGREDIALYTGNDDSIVVDLLTPYRFRVGDKTLERRFVGGLLGHWSVWTHKAVDVFQRCKKQVVSGADISADMLALATEVTDTNAAFFDAANRYRGCIAGLHEVHRRQGLLEGLWCLDPEESLSPGQAEEIDRIYAAYPHLNDDDFVAEHRDQWLGG